MGTNALARLFATRDRTAERLRKLDARLDEGVRAYSYEHGYRVPLRREAVRREVSGG